MQLFLTDRKLERRVTEAQKYRYRDVLDLEEFLVCQDEQGVVNPQVPTDHEGWETMSLGDRWEG
ncbi:MAG TPA: hypothetical protein H9809_02485, partial [Candidatus Blautia pullicola]|nr:hypothetical protein [Candidatus Blautia pullicola]